jgi:vacuolar-type H+-ATPase subunit F/Vma7
MSRLLILTRPNLLPGFHLAGVDAFAAEDAQRAQEVIDVWIEEREEGLLAIDEDLLACLEPAFLKRLRAAPHLPYLAIPGAGKTGPTVSARHRVADMIRRAIGFHITFKGEEERLTNDGQAY